MRTVSTLPKLPFPLRMIVNGGQTGADRARLDFATEHGIAHGGWCPKGRKAEDARIPDGLLPSARDAIGQLRTEWNVRDSVI
jgi:hypothetical protein